MLAEDNFALECPVCKDLYDLPIKLPCGHILCKCCLESVLQHTNLHCPICRHRLSIWIRRVKCLDDLVDNDLVLSIENLFPDFCQRRKLNKSQQFNDEERKLFNEIKNSGQSSENGCKISSPGSIHSEYLSILKKSDEEKLEQAKKDEAASLSLAKQLMQEEDLDTSISSSLNESLCYDDQSFYNRQPVNNEPKKKFKNSSITEFFFKKGQRQKNS